MLTLFPLKHGISPSKTAGFYRMTNRLYVMGSDSEGSISELCMAVSMSANRSFTIVQHDSFVKGFTSLQTLAVYSPRQPAFLLCNGTYHQSCLLPSKIRGSFC
jgi:hypothetical protein